MRNKSTTAVRLAAATALLWFIPHTIVPAWTRASSDFPNYYTAGKLARERQPLHLYYEWRWFQRQMHFAGIEHQIGGYIPQTPFTMAPFIPLSLLPALQARKILVVLNCMFLAFSLWLLSRLTSLTAAQLWLLAFLAGDALRSNFLLGQYYLIVLMLLTMAVYCLHRARDGAAGALLGIVFALKLYGGPLILPAILKQRWKAVVAFLAILIAAMCSAGIWFGWGELGRYGLEVFPRSLAGETLNPYHPSNGTMSTLLRRFFMAEAELNPHPTAPDAFLFYMCRAAFTLSVAVFTSLACIDHGKLLSKKTLAWWMVATLLVSPNTASYTFVLLILPVALVLDEMPRRRWLCVLAVYAAICLPLWHGWSRLFPRVWLILALFVIIGYRELVTIPARTALAGGAFILTVSAAIAGFEARSFRDEPAAHYTEIAAEPDAIYSNAPALAGKAMFYESIDTGRYVIREGNRSFSLSGESFHPAVPDSGTPVWFEHVDRTESQIVKLDPATGEHEVVPVGIPRPKTPAVSHDGSMLAFISEGRLYIFDGRESRMLPIPGSVESASFTPGDRRIVFAASSQGMFRIGILDINGRHAETLLESEVELAGPSISPDGMTLLFARHRRATWQVWIKQVFNGSERMLSDGDCNNSSPVWRAGSRQVIFASDCNRGLGLPALFMTPPLDLAGNVFAKPIDSEASLPFVPAVR